MLYTLIFWVYILLVTIPVAIHFEWNNNKIIMRLYAFYGIWYKYTQKYKIMIEVHVAYYMIVRYKNYFTILLYISNVDYGVTANFKS